MRAGTQTHSFRMAANGSLANQQFFIIPPEWTGCRVTRIAEVHSTAGSDSGAVTAYIEKLGSGVAVGSGTALCSAMSMKTTANIPQTATLSTSAPYGDGTSSVLDLSPGDRLAIVFAGTLTALAGVVVTISFTPAFKGECAVFNMQANGSLADQAFFIANRPMIISSVSYVHSAAGTDASAVNVQVTKDTGTNAPGAGTDLLTNNTNAGFNCKGTINVVQSGGLSATAANLRLAAGDRLSVDFAGTLTALAGVVVVVCFRPIFNRREITFNLAANGFLADQAFWISDGDYKVIAARYVNATAGSDGSAVNIQLTKDLSADAPGAGTDLLTTNTNAGANAKTTANTVELQTLADMGIVTLMANDVLSVDFAGTLTALAGVVLTVSLEPV